MKDPQPSQETVERLTLKGRIDSITAREVETLFKNAIMNGKRLIVADMTDVNYVSSAGLRVFFTFQKELKKAGGEICLLNTADMVLSVFKISGFTSIFRFLSSEEEARTFTEDALRRTQETREVSAGPFAMRVLSRTLRQGRLSVIGNEEKLLCAGYSEADVATVRASDLHSATGLAALGNAYEDYKDYFGETAVIDGNIFVYPALKRSAVDFIIHSEGEEDILYHFLYGFSFRGELSHIASFEPNNGFFTLDDLVDSVFLVASSNIVGITAIFESKGILGMRLKKVPIRETQGKTETDIFSRDSFTEWIDYSIEPEDIYNLVVLTGIAVRDRGAVRGEAGKIIPREGRFHIHGVVFDKKPFNKAIDNFPHEIRRVVTGMEPQRVLHLLGKTRIGPGLMGIVELGG
jgi:anti-anti-sigma factor